MIVEVLGRIGPPAKEAVPAIAEVLHDKDRQLRLRPPSPWDISVPTRTGRGAANRIACGHGW